MRTIRKLCAVASMLCFTIGAFDARLPDVVSKNVADLDPVKNEYNIPTPDERQAVQEKRFHRRTAALRDTKYRWTNKVVNFKFGSKFSGVELQKIHRGFKEIEHYTCVTFMRNSTAKNKVNIVKKDGCYSTRLGMYGGTQELSLGGRGCVNRRTILHELLHVLGIHHEHVRPDRDEYIIIKSDYASTANYKKTTRNKITTYNLSYDFDSVMHYRGYDVITTKDPKYQNIIGTNPHLSLGDIRTINNMYPCVPASCKLKDYNCGKNGFVGKDCLCWCPGPTKSHPVEYCFEKDKTIKGSLDFNDDK